MLKKFQADIEQYVATDEKHPLVLLFSKNGLWALAEYRFSNWVYTSIHIPLIRELLTVFCMIWHRLTMLITGIELPKQADIGAGLYIAHSGCIVLHSDVILGKHCTISQDVTIGMGGRGSKKGCPCIGDRVYIAPGARVFGAIVIGNDVAIGANAVVTKDLPDNAVAVGIPAKIINYKGSQDFICLPDRSKRKVSRLTELSDKIESENSASKI